MKTKMLAACMLAAITFSLFSCDWVSKKKNISLAGKWKITGIADSSVSGANGQSFFIGFNVDSSNAVVSFGADSSITYTANNEQKSDTAKYYTDEGLHIIYVHGANGNKIDTFPVLSLTDTLLTVVKDRVHITLKRLP